MNKIRVESDGTREGTKFFNADGTEIKDVCRATIDLDAKHGAPMVTLQFVMRSCDVVAENMTDKTTFA